MVLVCLALGSSHNCSPVFCGLLQSSLQSFSGLELDFKTLLFRRFIHEASAQNAAIQYNHTKYSADKGVLAFYNELMRRADCMVEPPDSYSFRRKYLGGLPQTIIKMALKARGISAEHSSIEEILDEVKRVESAQKALNLYTKQSVQAGGERSPMQHANSEPTKGQKDGGNC